MSWLCRVQWYWWMQVLFPQNIMASCLFQLLKKWKVVLRYRRQISTALHAVKLHNRLWDFCVTEHRLNRFKIRFSVWTVILNALLIRSVFGIHEDVRIQNVDKFCQIFCRNCFRILTFMKIKPQCPWKRKLYCCFSWYSDNVSIKLATVYWSSAELSEV